MFIANLEAMQATNVVADAPKVRAETLIVSPAGAGLPIRHAHQAASLIPRANLMMVEQAVSFINTDAARAIILRFLEGASPEAPPASHASAGTAIILFADIADSTTLTERMGDAAFRTKARDLDVELRRIIADAGGTTIDAKTLGDGVLATFPAASQAIGAALRCG